MAVDVVINTVGRRRGPPREGIGSGLLLAAYSTCLFKGIDARLGSPAKWMLSHIASCLPAPSSGRAPSATFAIPFAIVLIPHTCAANAVLARPGPAWPDRSWHSSLLLLLTQLSVHYLSLCWHLLFCFYPFR